MIKKQDKYLNNKDLLYKIKPPLKLILIGTIIHAILLILNYFFENTYRLIVKNRYLFKFIILFGVFIFMTGLFTLVFTLVDFFYLRFIKSKRISNNGIDILLKPFIWLLTSIILFIIGFIFDKFLGNLIPSLLGPLYSMFIIYNVSFFIIVALFFISNIISIAYKKMKGKK